MAKVVLMVGTRKGCFLLESDEDARDWEVRGPFCEGWPIYHAVHDAESGAIYAAAASEWHGAGVWRSDDLGENWELSSEGLEYGGDGLKLSKISGLAAAHGRVLAGGEAAGIFESRDGGATWSLLSTLDGQPGRDDWNEPSNQPPGHLGHAGAPPPPRRRRPVLGVVQGFGIFETTDDGAIVDTAQRGTARRLAARAPRGRLLRPQARDGARDHDRLYQQNHCGMHRSDDGGRSWVEITEGLPTDFGFAAAAHPHDRDSFYVIPLDPGHGRCMPEGSAAVWRTSDAGSTWQRLDNGLPQRDALPRRPARGDGDRRRSTRPASTSARAPARCSRAPTRARAGTRSRATCPAIASVEVAVIGIAMADAAPARHAAAAVRRPAAAGRRRGGDGGRGDRPARRAVARAPRPAVRAGAGAAAAHQRLRRPRARRARDRARAPARGST